MDKRIKQIVNGTNLMMGDLKISQPLPVHQLDEISPFVLLHHAGPQQYGAGERGVDVSPHPHRGFEAVSLVFRGEVEHRDSIGNHDTVTDGGVQWLTAGSGVIHTGGATTSFHEKGGVFEMIQLWINLPKKFKMIDPDYQAFEKEDIPFYKSKNARVNVISGEINDLKGPVKSLTDVLAFTLEMQPEGEVKFDIQENRNVLLYQLNGKTSVNGEGLDDKKLVEFESVGTKVVIKSEKTSVLLFLVGDPIDEPTVKHGPFVMNTQVEIQEAMEDYQAGKMGVLTD